MIEGVFMEEGLTRADLKTAVNMPDKENPGQRIIGWRVPADKAGLSYALDFLGKIKNNEADTRTFNEGYDAGIADARQEADRDYFAAQALTGICMFTNSAPIVAKIAYAVADAMLEARLQPRTINQETKKGDGTHPTSPASEKAFHERFAKDNCEAMTDEQWGVWVNALPKDEFWSMMELGLNEPNRPMESVG